jgi:pyrimidine deaminase RibD-like protein
MDYMARALQLASRALGTCSPNPAVGAVLVRDGEVVGEGATQPAGQAHAEIVALQAAGSRARGSTLYVSLEPCAHFGRTPPCANAIVEAGIARAVVAMRDPSPWVDGGGIAILERAGISISIGSREREARLLNEAYLTWLARGRPLVSGVYAIGLDGRSCPLTEANLGLVAARELGRLRTSAAHCLAGPEQITSLIERDPELRGLAADGVTGLHLEVSPTTLRLLAHRGLLDRLAVFLTPTLSTDLSAPPDAVASEASAAPAIALQAITTERLGDTILITGYLPNSVSPLFEPHRKDA